MRIGIVAGLPQELAAFAPDRPATISNSGQLAIRTVDLERHRVSLCCGGIGKVAAATAAGLLAAGGAELLMVIGTAAAVRSGPGRCFRISHAVQHDYGARRPERFARYRAGTIPIGSATLTPFEALDVTGCDLPPALIASGDMFVESAEHAREIGASLGADLIDMETAAVAQTAALLGLPWLAIKASTDEAGEDSAELFEQNLLAAATQSAQAAERLIGSLPA